MRLEFLVLIGVFYTYCFRLGCDNHQVSDFIARELILIDRVTEERITDMKGLNKHEGYKIWGDFLDDPNTVKYYPARIVVECLIELSFFDCTDGINGTGINLAKILIHLFQFSLMGIDPSTKKSKVDELVSYLSDKIYKMLENCGLQDSHMSALTEGGPELVSVPTFDSTSGHFGVSEEVKEIIRKVIWKDRELLIPNPIFVEFLLEQVSMHAYIIYQYLLQRPFKLFNFEAGSQTDPEKFQKVWVDAWNMRWSEIKPALLKFFDSDVLSEQVIRVICSSIRRGFQNHEATSSNINS